MARRLLFIDLDVIRSADKRLVELAEKERDTAESETKYSIEFIIGEASQYIPEAKMMTFLRRTHQFLGSRTDYAMKSMCRIVERHLAGKDAVLDDENV